MYLDLSFAPSLRSVSLDLIPRTFTSFGKSIFEHFRVVFLIHCSGTSPGAYMHPGRPLTGITIGPDDAATRHFPSSIQADMDFEDCLPASSFSDQQVTSSLALLIHGPWFSPADVEVDGSVAYSYLHTGVKLWCAATTNSSRLLERCYNDVASFLNLFQRGLAREKLLFSLSIFNVPAI